MTPEMGVYDQEEAAADIATHAAIAAAHHAKYTDGEADARADAKVATHAALPTVHQDAPALIAVHAALPTVHQDAPALIATHTAIAAAHHAKTGNNEVYGLLLCDIVGNRPAPAVAGRFFWATDEHILYRDTGAAWVKAAVADHADLDGIGAADHHAKYTDAEAVTAMGVLGDANPLNHNRATEWGAAEHTAIGDAAPHHVKTPDPTKELFVPVTSGTLMTNRGNVPVGRCLLAAEAAFVSFRVPHDFTTIVNAELIVIPTVTAAAANYDIYAHYAAIGELYSTHNESDTASTYNVTAFNYFAINISGILTALAAGDQVGIKLSQGDAAHDVDVVGVRFRYS